MTQGLLEMANVIGWVGWFVDVPNQNFLKRISSKDAVWGSLPRDGCLGFIFFEEGGLKTIRSGFDYYFKAEGRLGPIYGADVDIRERDTRTEILERYKNPSVIRGIWTDEETIAQVGKEQHSVKFEEL